MFRVSAVPGILAAAILSCPLPALAQQAAGPEQLPVTVPDSLPATAPPMPGSAPPDTMIADDTGDAEAAELQSELDDARAELEALREQLPEADAQFPVAPAEGSTGAAVATPADTPADLPSPDALATGAPRDPALVASVLAGAPGAPTDPAAQERLRELLVQGVCAPDALAQVQDPINRQTLLALMTRLPRC